MKELLDEFFNKIEIKKVNPRRYSPLDLAFIGDSIYDLIIRTKVISKGNVPVNKLHLNSRDYVNAAAQAKMILLLKEELTEEEYNIYKRGRNAKSVTMPKNASMIDYRNATGYETLMGFLYLDGNLDRLIYIVNKGIELFNNTNKDE